VQLLRSALPGLHLSWAGFRNVRGQVCKRLSRRIRNLSLPDARAYREYLEAHADEWMVLAGLCRITISRFYRDRGVFDQLANEILPSLAASEPVLRCWSVGCASGEEPYTLAILWRSRVKPARPAARMTVLGTDVDARVLERARAGCYGVSSLKELPLDLRERAFTRADDVYCLRDEYRDGVDFRLANVRQWMPDERFHVVLCRNLVFTYFDEQLQLEVVGRIEEHLVPGGFLIIGRHESLPTGARVEPWKPGSSIFVLRA
jgi:chemotaxis protein methyltransferase CheR